MDLMPNIAKMKMKKKASLFISVIYWVAGAGFE